MKTKELKIVPPEGYEVDWDNSPMNVIRFKPIKKKITYEDVKAKLFAESKASFFLGHDGAIMQTFNIKYLSRELLLSTSQQQLQQIKALNKLMNVAKYLNGDWEPDWNTTKETKWCIFFEHTSKKLDVFGWSHSHYTSVVFKTPLLARQAIEILGEEEVKKALGIFE